MEVTGRRLLRLLGATKQLVGPRGVAVAPRLWAAKRLASSSAAPAAPASPPLSPELSQLLAEQTPGFSLTRPFYVEPALHDEDLRRVFQRSWLFAAHTCELRAPGDYQVYDIAPSLSVIVARGKDGAAHAYHNTCRHRGSKLCAAEVEPGESQHRGGNSFVCPYHRWKYNLTTGECMSAPTLPADQDITTYGLHRVGVGEVGGMIFVHLGGVAEQGSFEEFAEHVGPTMEAQGLAHAKIAQVEDFVVESNWKLLYENNRECDHCVHGHPEYNAVNFDVEFAYAMSLDEGGELVNYGGDLLPPERVVDSKGSAKRQAKLRAEIAAQDARTGALWEEWGMPTITSVPEFPGSGWFRAARTFFREGFVSQTLDGKPGCWGVPLATPPRAPDGWGTEDWDLGVLKINTFPNFWSYCMSDHAAATRLTPIDAHRTHVRQYWLVHRDAEDGRDFDLARMKHVWHQTLLQDNELCCINHAGVRSEAYTPGPYSPAKEAAVDFFVHGWYLRKFRGEK